jgi:hypothetical protein
VSVPFAAIKGFFDPSVQFGLQFQEDSGAEEAPQPEENTAAASESIRAPSEHKAIAPTIAPVPVAANTEPAKTTSHPEAEKPAAGEVVQLDRFRKK